MSKIIETSRLILRTWEPEDTEPYFKMNQDPHVLEFLPGPLSMEKVENFISKMNLNQEKLGFTLWAIELKNTREFLGFIGLNYTDWESNFTPAVEVGWRLASQHWGKGYATEGAMASLAYGFKECQLKEIISFTVPANSRSIRVMEKIGLTRDLQGDFAHPNLPADHPLSQHVLYRLTADEYFRAQHD